MTKISGRPKRVYAHTIGTERRQHIVPAELHTGASGIGAFYAIGSGDGLSAVKDAVFAGLPATRPSQGVATEHIKEIEVGSAGTLHCDRPPVYRIIKFEH